jgi:hypothetical protein
MLEHALKYAALGWHVFPLQPGAKEPITPHGVKDASTYEEKIRMWWHIWPDANIGLACGKASGVSAVDIDYDPKKGINGYKSLAGLPLPTTVQQRTPRGGFHAIYKTNNPPKNKNDWKPGIDIRGEGYYIVLAPSVTKDGKYEWLDNEPTKAMTPVEYPDAFRPQKRVPTKQNPCMPVRPSQSSDLARRVSAYMKNVKPAVQGQDGHGSLFWAAQVLVNGFCLSDSEAYRVLATEYNPMCSPPWDLSNQSEEKDFRRKITQARENPPAHLERGWLLKDDIYDTPKCLVNIESIMAPVWGKLEEQSMEEDVILTKEEEQALEFLTKPTGILGEICSWINSCSLRRQPFLALGAALTYLGALYGRKIRDHLDSRTNLYCMGIANSSAGKNIAPKMLRKLAFQSESMDIMAGNSIASDTSIEECMSKNPSSVFMLDEIGLLLSDIKSGKNVHRTNVVATLMQFWSSAGDIFLGKEYADKDSQRTLMEPCLCIWGVSTPKRFTEGIAVEQLEDGWLGRCLIFHAAETPKKDRGINVTDPPQSIVDHCLHWSRFNPKQSDGKTVVNFVRGKHNAPPNPVVVPTSPEAEAIYKDLDDFAFEQSKKDTSEAMLWTKAEENARRIGLILAASENLEDIEVSGANALYAAALVKHSLNTFKRIITPTVYYNNTEKIKNEIRGMVGKFKSGCPKWKIGRKTQKLSREHRDSALADLVECGFLLVTKENDGKRGRPGEVYWTPETWQKNQ